MRQAIIYRDLEDGGWIVEVPSLPGCIGQGDTRDEALSDATVASQEWIAAAIADGRPVPQETGDAEIVSLAVEK